MKFNHSYLLLFLLSCLSWSLNAQSESKSERTERKSEVVESRGKIGAEPNIELELKNARTNAEATVLPVQSASVYMEPVGEVNLDPTKLQGKSPQDLLAKEEMKYHLVLRVFNPANIARIHVKLGVAEGKSNFVSHAFEFDRAAPAPLHYTRDGRIIVLGLGKYTNMGPCFGEVTLEDLNGKRSAPKTFSIKG